MLTLPPTWPGWKPSRTNHHLKARAALVLEILGCGHLVAEVPADHDTALCRTQLDAELDRYFREGA